MKPTLEKAMQLLQLWVDTAADNSGAYLKLTTDTRLFLQGMAHECPGHVAHYLNPKICRYCATHIDEYR